MGLRTKALLFFFYCIVFWALLSAFHVPGWLAILPIIILSALASYFTPNGRRGLDLDREDENEDDFVAKVRAIKEMLVSLKNAVRLGEGKIKIGAKLILPFLIVIVIVTFYTWSTAFTHKTYSTQEILQNNIEGSAGIEGGNYKCLDRCTVKIAGGNITRTLSIKPAMGYADLTKDLTITTDRFQIKFWQAPSNCLDQVQGKWSISGKQYAETVYCASVYNYDDATNSWLSNFAFAAKKVQVASSTTRQEQTPIVISAFSVQEIPWDSGNINIFVEDKKIAYSTTDKYPVRFGGDINIIFPSSARIDRIEVIS